MNHKIKRRITNATFCRHARRLFAALLGLSLIVAPVFSAGAGASLLLKYVRLAIAGDSITEQKIYSRDLEMYLTVCQPQLEACVFQFGSGGETAGGFLSRMDADLKYFKPTMVTLCYGMNDGHYHAYEPSLGEAYEKALAEIVSKLKSENVQPVVSGPGAVDTEYFKSRGLSVPCDVYNQTLQELSAIAGKVAASNQCPHVDLHGLMMEVMAKAKLALGQDYDVCGRDGVHPHPNGHLIMAYAFLKDMGFDGDLGTVTLDYQGKSSAEGGHVLKSFDQGQAVVESHRYPFCFSGDVHSTNSADSILPFLPFNFDLNRLTLVVKHAPSEKMKVTWGKQQKVFSKTDLKKGINLAAEFNPNPFNADFERVETAVAAKQAYETDMIKNMAHGLRAVRNSYQQDKEAMAAVDLLDRKMIERWEDLNAKVKASFKPVTSTIRIESASE